MMQKLETGFSTITDLADTLVQLHKISFRQAHDIIVQVTLEALNNGIKAEDIPPSDNSVYLRKYSGKTLIVKQRSFTSSIESKNLVLLSKFKDAPAPEAV
ncbi:hypothetical protein GF326_08160 [Candidatus Bathyarchaeota archaeon]|nr:hypothetical protein [Candidatus Bathyarchaeota archaeon]